jgi:hypothetical protein
MTKKQDPDQDPFVRGTDLDPYQNVTDPHQTNQLMISEELTALLRKFMEMLQIK